ncbi:hypothetical protein DSO57_1030269 [Entomophthora muscae]|uniref:Uncharacterized protein n=1 Tax=Entomophthora muscae TaxID=34485 RepID=A0ACC2S319_9FUNG|nr:hypothetical protein DSO57_1030269 [Entomophthora muscae]
MSARRGYMQYWGLYLVILGQVLPWWVRDAEPFLCNFVVAVYFQDGHACSGALYREDVAIVPTSCIQGQMSQARVELIRHNQTKPRDEDGLAQPAEPGNFTSPYHSHTTHILAIHFLNEVTCLYLASAATAKAGIKIEMISEEVPWFLMGWGENKVLSQTVTHVLWKGQPNIKTSWMDFRRTIREPVNFHSGIEFMKGSPLVHFSRKGPVLFGLVEDQYRTSVGLSEAKVIPLLLYRPSIEAAIRVIFQTTLVPKGSIP